MDKICIKDLEVFANHGVFKEENVLGQKFIISLVLYMDTKQAGKTDDLKESVNYGEVAEFVTEIAQKRTYKLIEALAENVAESILLKFALVKKVEVEIKKPWAPVHLPLETVSVDIERGWHLAYLGIGSNMGDKKANLDRAIELLNEDNYTEVRKISSFITTEPVGYEKQDDFLNGALLISTLRTPGELLDLIGDIEKDLKRERIIHWGPRTIDLDILLYDDEVIFTENLIIPHIEMKNRRFVLEPLSEIAPYKMHPVLNKSIIELLSEL